MSPRSVVYALPARREAFTLIELLVVVAIISILSGIAVPNFLDAQVRSKVSRMRTDMRTLATAIEAYHVDNNAYPRRQIPSRPSAPPGSSPPLQTGDVTKRAEDMSRLTTPVSYMESLAPDIFEVQLAPPNNLIDYWDRNIILEVRGTVSNLRPTNPKYAAVNDRWAFFSVGPDRHFGNVSSNLGNYPRSTTLPSSYAVDYDPTNGTVSPGNVWRFSSNRGAINVLRD